MGRFGYRIYLIMALIVFMFVAVIPIKFSSVQAEENTNIKIHYIDVGQGDSTFIEFSDGKTMLIDGGEEDYGKRVVKYIKNLGYTKIDYMVATHSDSDHIGGLITVLKKMEVGVIYRPFTISVNSEYDFVDELYTQFLTNLNSYQVDTSDTYAEFLSLVYDETINDNLSTIKTISSAENLFSQDENNPYLIKFFMPRAEECYSTLRIDNCYTVNKHEDNNDSSAVIEIITESSKFLFMGDLTTEGESEFLDSISDRTMLASVSVLKVGHHGAKTSTSAELLNLINPKFAIVSVGEDNDYGHPASATLNRLSSAGAIIYRTDNMGTIIVEERGGILYFTNIETKSFFVKYPWVLYLIITVVIVGLVVMVLVYERIKKRKNVADEDYKLTKPVDKVDIK